MIILDENIIASQRALLRAWRIRFRRVGEEVAEFGAGDDRVASQLHRLSQPTFFTRDVDFYRHDLCHSHYCLVYLNVPEHEAAEYIRRVLRHSMFATHAKRGGCVVEASPGGMKVLRKNQRPQAVGWLTYRGRFR